MPASGTIHLEGQFEKDVLGAFRIIRGFAKLQDLAAISCAYPLDDADEAATGQVVGHQRALDPKHAADIEQYLDRGRARFFPEIILSMRAEFHEEDPHVKTGESQGVYLDDALIKLERRWSGPNFNTHTIDIKRRDLEALLAERRIRRIDGNHRLEAAANLEEDDTRPNKYLAPFCMVLLNPVGDADHDYTESVLFHTINSTPLLLESEHALRLILGQAPELRSADDEEFAELPALHLTRLLRDRIGNMPPDQRERLGQTPCSAMHAIAQTMLALEPERTVTLDGLAEYVDAWCGALTDVLSQVSVDHPRFCATAYFPELAYRVWQSACSKHPPESATRAAVQKLGAIADWLGRDGLYKIQAKRSLAGQILEIHDKIEERVPKRVFLVRWYPTAADGEEKRKSDLRLGMINRLLDDLKVEGINLTLDDPGTEEGATFGIRKEMYDALAENDIILVDLSGVRPNACVEAGFALRHRGQERLLFMFQETGATPNNRAFTSPPFDLTDFRYEQINDAAEIPGKLKGHIKAIISAHESGIVD